MIDAKLLEEQCHRTAVRAEWTRKFSVIMLWVALVVAFVWAVWS